MAENDRMQREENEGMQKVGRVAKAILVIFMFILAGLLFFRFWLNGYYPSSVRQLVPTEELRSAYAEGEGPLAKKQEIRVSYDDPNEGLFFANHTVFVEETGSLQVTVRFNTSTLTKLAEKYGEAFDPDAEDPFTYRIFAARSAGKDSITVNGEEIRGDYYTVRDSRAASFAMYRYERLAFEGVEFDGVSWIRLEIGHAAKEYESDIVVYENHDDYNEFEEYKVNKTELE